MVKVAPRSDRGKQSAIPPRCALRNVNISIDEPSKFQCRESNPSPVSDHPIGVERITELRIVTPKEYQPVAAFTYLEKGGIFKSAEGKEWAIKITFDGGRKAQMTSDRRPLATAISRVASRR